LSALDLPPDFGLAGTPLGVFTAPARARRLSAIAVALVLACGALTWWRIGQHPYRAAVATQAVLPAAFSAFALLGFAVRRARVAISRDGVRWGWRALGFTQQTSRIAWAHVYRDGVALEAKRGAWWFIAARDWDRFDALVRQLRRAELPVRDHDGTAPLRARLQSYGRFLDGLLAVSIVGAAGVLAWAA
jgi:hypothetical protein